MKFSSIRQRQLRFPWRLASRAFLILTMGFMLVSTFLDSARAQVSVDTILVRPAQMINGRVLSIDDQQVVVDTIPYQRATVDWVSFNGAGRYPRPVTDPMRVDVVQLASGENVLGRLTSFSRGTVTVDTIPSARVIPFDQISAVVFCDAPCGVSAGVVADPALIASEAQRLAALPPVAGNVGLASSPVPGLAGISSVPSISGTPALDLCRGDERMTFAPQEPKVGDELLIAVSSAGRTQYPRLAGTEAAAFQREREGQLGWVYEWIVRPTWSGDQEYTFYVDSTVPCKTEQIDVGRPLRTPTPKVPRYTLYP